MQEIETTGFSLTALLLVTGFCFLSFYQFFRILDGVNNKLFVWIGLVSVGSGLLTGTIIYFTRKNRTTDENYSE